MQKLIDLCILCRGSVSLNVNEHRDCYETVESYLKNKKQEISSEIMAEMIERNFMVELQFYPRTPIGFYCIYHYDIEKAVDRALELTVKDLS